MVSGYSDLRIPRTKSLCLLVRDKIITYIDKEKFLSEHKLPSENRLAELFGVGRSTVREAMRLLEEEGFIVRKAGKGTFVHDKSLLPVNPFDRALSISELITNMHKQPGVKNLSYECSTVGTDSLVIEKLNLNKTARVITINRVMTADGTPVVHQKIFIPQLLINRRQITRQSFAKSIWALLERNHILVEYVIAELIPAVASEYIAKELTLHIDDPLMFVKQIGYTRYYQKVFYVREHWRKEWLRFKVFRKR